MPLIESILHLHKQHRGLTHLSFWVVVYGYTSFLHQVPVFSPLIVEHLLVAFIRITTAYFVVYGLFPFFVERGRLLEAVCLYTVGAYGIFVVSRWLEIICLPLVNRAGPAWYTLFDWQEFVSYHVFSHLGAAALLLLIKLLVHRSDGQRKALLLEKQKADLELKVLKNQLNPHFLFNTLNNIYALSVTGSTHTAQAIAHLSEMLDYVLYRGQQRAVPLSSEVAQLKNYIALETLRYDDRLRVCFQPTIDDDLWVAPLLLLSIVENAFKHGASEDAGSPTIAIELVARDQLIHFRATNSVATPEPVTKLDRIGLPNLKQQLALLYPNRHTLTIHRQAGSFVVDLILHLYPNISDENPLSTSR